MDPRLEDNTDLQSMHSDPTADDDDGDLEVEWAGICYESGSQSNENISSTDFPLSGASSARSTGEAKHPVVELFPGAARVEGKGENLFEKIKESARREPEREGNAYYPFSCEMDWEVALWLSRLNVSQAKVDEFFRLKYVRRLPSY